VAASESRFVVRAASADDVAALARMKTEFAREEGTPEVVSASEADWLRDLFGVPPRFHALVAERGGEIIGMLIYAEKFHPAWVGATLCIRDVYVQPKGRRQGIAAALLRHLAAHALERGMLMMELTVHRDNAARDLYHAVGFRHLNECLTYLIAGPALTALASQSRHWRPARSPDAKVS
jgi:ribosomal protein S18 acetylase RimI-like enzyme